MKLYMVVFDTSMEEYGAIIETFGIYDTRDKAKERVEALRCEMFVPENYEDCIVEIELNKDCEKDLGGYIE